MTSDTPESAGPPKLTEQEFGLLMAAAQPRLRGYVASLLGSWSDVDDVVQETNLVMIRKRGTFEAGTNFIAWACRIAYFKAGNWRRDRYRENRTVFSEEFFQEVAAQSEEWFAARRNVGAALGDCLKRLTSQDRELVEIKYVRQDSLVSHARDLGCSAQSLHKRISRIRLLLRDCIRRKIQSEPA